MNKYIIFSLIAFSIGTVLILTSPPLIDTLENAAAAIDAKTNALKEEMVARCIEIEWKSPTCEKLKAERLGEAVTNMEVQ